MYGNPYMSTMPNVPQPFGYSPQNGLYNQPNNFTPNQFGQPQTGTQTQTSGITVGQVATIEQIEQAQLMKLSSAENTPIDVSGDSEFLKAVKDKNSAAVWAILDDLLDTLKATAPRVYESVLRKIKEL